MRIVSGGFEEFLKFFFPPPPFFCFNRKLYAELVRECADGGTITAPEAEPEVEFAMGPIDGKLGEFDHRTMRITVDVLEIFFTCLFEPVQSIVASLKQKFDERLTQTLAHEGGHWHLEKRCGFWVRAEKIAIHMVFMLGYGILVWLAISTATELTFGKLPKALEGLVTPAVGATIAATAFLAFFLLYLKFSGYFIAFWRTLAFAVSYKVCYTERFARKFAEKPGKDRRWDDVITLPP